MILTNNSIYYKLELNNLYFISIAKCYQCTLHATRLFSSFIINRPKIIYIIPKIAEATKISAQNSVQKDSILDIKENLSVENSYGFSENNDYDETWYETSPRVSSVLDDLEKKDIIDYATAGKYKDNGSARLTEYGRELDRKSNSLDHDIKKRETPISQTDPVEYDIVRLDIHEDTVLATPLQTHPLLIARDANNIPSKGLGIATLTSESGTKKGILNVALSDSKLDNSNQTQYARPLVPPVEIKLGQAEVIEESISYIQNKTQEEINDINLSEKERLDLEDTNIKIELRRIKCDFINEQVRDYAPIEYSTKGHTMEDLVGLSELDNINQQIENDSVQHEEVD